MKRIVKISGESGSGKSHLLSLVADCHKNHVLVDGSSTLNGILQAVRNRENVNLLIDECPAELLAALEAITEHSAVWGRIGCVYAVVRPQDSQLADAAPLLLAAIKRLIDHKDLDLFGQATQAAKAIWAAGGDV